MLAIPPILVGGRHTAPYAVLGTTVHRHDELGGDGEDADQRARGGQKALTDPRVRRVLRRCWRATHRSQYQRYHYSGGHYNVTIFVRVTHIFNRT